MEEAKKGLKPVPLARRRPRQAYTDAEDELDEEEDEEEEYSSDESRDT